MGLGSGLKGSARQPIAVHGTKAGGWVGAADVQCRDGEGPAHLVKVRGMVRVRGRVRGREGQG